MVRLQAKPYSKSKFSHEEVILSRSMFFGQFILWWCTRYQVKLQQQYPFTTISANCILAQLDIYLSSHSLVKPGAMHSLQKPEGCSLTPCLNNGKCVLLWNNHSRCICNRGWSGARCETRISICTTRTNLCHRGQCVEVLPMKGNG